MTQNANIQDLKNKLWDVIIIGAGPAGSAAAITLVKNNFSVLLIDKEEFPREKVCGDGLIGDTQKILKRFGLLEKVLGKGHRVEKLSVFSPSRHEIMLDVPTITIRRKIFDFILADKAVESGAEFVKGRIIGVDEKSEAIEVIDDKKNIFRSKFSLIATGADLSLVKSQSVQNKIPDTIALRTYYKSKDELDRLVVTYDKSIMPGYGWIFPMGNGEFNIGCGVFGESKNGRKINLKVLLDKFINEFPFAKNIVNKGERIEEIRGARLRCGLKTGRAVINNRILAIGETISTTFNYTGEGIGKAMESGELAGELLCQSLKNGKLLHLSYGELLQEKYAGLFDGYRTAQNWLSNKFVTDFMIKRTQKSNYLKNTITSVLNNDDNPAKVFSINGLIRSFVS